MPELHGIDIERALWLGVRNETTINGKPARLSGGVEWTLNNYNGGSQVKDAAVRIIRLV